MFTPPLFISINPFSYRSSFCLSLLPIHKLKTDILLILDKILDILEDSKQQLYTYCSYTSPVGTTCLNPVPKYLDPLLCGGHWDQIKASMPSDTDSESDDETVKHKN